jgi:hypothetical protein
MNWIKTVLREVYGLFVDDLRFTFSILAWLGLIWLGAQETTHLHSAFTAWLPAVLLFAGLAGILLESALRFARSRR